METIKSYTDLEQSKKLAEILPLESADAAIIGKDNIIVTPYNVTIKSQLPGFIKENDIIPCWSLAALLSVLLKGTNISTPKPTNALGYCCWNQYDEIYADNPVDVCYEMILKLHELKIL